MAVQQRSAVRYDPTSRYELDIRDVEYRKDGERSWLARVYQPRGSGPFPTLIEIHGGAWNNGDRTQNAIIDEALARTGLVIAAIDFHLGTEASYPASMADVNYGIRWLKAHAAEFNGSASPLGGLGYSSGGHMVMLSALRPSDARYGQHQLGEAPGLDASLDYVVMGWPVIDPYARYRYAKEIGREELVAATERYFLDEAGMQEASPQHILERGEAVSTPPALIVQGAEDKQLAPGIAERFVEAYGSAGGVIELAKYPGAGHGFAREAGPNTDRAMAVIESFIARQLAERSD